MLKSTFISPRASALLALIFLVLVHRAGTADSFKLDDHAFNVSPGADTIEQSVLAALAFAGPGSEVHPVAQRWRKPPCVNMAGTLDDDSWRAFRAAWTALSQKLGIGLKECAPGDALSITYFFATGANPKDERNALESLLKAWDTPSQRVSGFLDGSSTCYWRYKSAAETYLALNRAVVGINASELSATQQERCILVGTIVSLGVLNPFSQGDDSDFAGASTDQWQAQLQFMMLAAFVLYQVDDRSMRGNYSQFAASVHSILSRMTNQ
jgi:hypothetical protein